MQSDLKTERFKIICHLCDKEFVQEDVDIGIVLMADEYAIFPPDHYHIQNLMQFNPVHLKCMLEKLKDVAT